MIYFVSVVLLIYHIFAYSKDGHINDSTLLALPLLVSKPLLRPSLLHRFAIVREMGIAPREG